MKGEMISKVKLMSEVKVVRRWVRPRQAVEAKPAAGSLPSLRIRPDIDVVAIGASTGGPVALRTILSGLQPDFQVPVLIVQHIAAGFIRGMVEWLSGTSGLRLHVAEEGDKLQRSHAYFAPDGVDMGVDKSQHIRLRSDGRSVTTPSVSHLFRSVAEAYGENAAGVLLTGMGKDGAEELKLMKEKGALTVAQDRESSVVFGMPGEAIRINAAACVLPPHEIALMLGRLGASRATRPEAG